LVKAFVKIANRVHRTAKIATSRPDASPRTDPVHRSGVAIFPSTQDARTMETLGSRLQTFPFATHSTAPAERNSNPQVTVVHASPLDPVPTGAAAATARELTDATQVIASPMVPDAHGDPAALAGRTGIELLMDSDKEDETEAMGAPASREESFHEPEIVVLTLPRSGPVATEEEPERRCPPVRVLGVGAGILGGLALLSEANLQTNTIGDPYSNFMITIWLSVMSLITGFAACAEMRREE